MVNIANELQAFRPINIERIPTDDKRFTPQVKIAFELYNKALNEIKDGYRDIAKSDLRKAVALCPEFSSAIMVLGILVFANGDRIGAVRVFNSVKDRQDREKAIAILDRLISEAEKPVGNSRNDYNTRPAQRPVAEQPRRTERRTEQRTEQRTERSTENTDQNAGGEDRPVQRQRPSYRSPTTYTREEKHAEPAREQGTAIPNKMLLAILAILIAFAVIASALLVSMSTGDNKADGVLPTAGASESGHSGGDKPGPSTAPGATSGVDYPLY